MYFKGKFLDTITVKDCLHFLIGKEDAIRKLAKSKSSLYLGAFFVLIAGIAREYDQEYIPENGILFLVPFIASFVMCSVLYILSLLYFRKRENQPRLGSFRTYLSLFWLTAPCAWIYALPVEAWFEPLTALKINLSLLAIVAVWRVLLFTRIIEVLTGVNIISLIFAISTPIIFFISFFSSFSIVGIMSGGVKTEAQKFLGDVTGFVAMACLFMFIPALICAGMAMRNVGHYDSLQKPEPLPVAKNLILWNGIILGFFILLLIPSQIKLSNHTKLKNLIYEENILEAINYSNTLTRKDLPHAVKLYPTIRYYGFSNAVQTFSQMDGTEADWFQEDVKTWIKMGIERRRHWDRNVLAACSLNEYQLRFLKEHKEGIQRLLKHINKEEYKALTPLINALELEIPEPRS